jgi:hypothetical protein
MGDGGVLKKFWSSGWGRMKREKREREKTFRQDGQDIQDSGRGNHMNTKQERAS